MVVGQAGCPQRLKRALQNESNRRGGFFRMLLENQRFGEQGQKGKAPRSEKPVILRVSGNDIGRHDRIIQFPVGGGTVIV